LLYTEDRGAIIFNAASQVRQNAKINKSAYLTVVWALL